MCVFGSLLLECAVAGIAMVSSSKLHQLCSDLVTQRKLRTFYCVVSLPESAAVIKQLSLKNIF